MAATTPKQDKWIVAAYLGIATAYIIMAALKVQGMKKGH